MLSGLYLVRPDGTVGYFCFCFFFCYHPVSHLPVFVAIHVSCSNTCLLCEVLSFTLQGSGMNCITVGSHVLFLCLFHTWLAVTFSFL